MAESSDVLRTVFGLLVHPNDRARFLLVSKHTRDIVANLTIAETICCGENEVAQLVQETRLGCRHTSVQLVHHWSQQSFTILSNLCCLPLLSDSLRYLELELQCCCDPRYPHSLPHPPVNLVSWMPKQLEVLKIRSFRDGCELESEVHILSISLCLSGLTRLHRLSELDVSGAGSQSCFIHLTSTTAVAACDQLQTLKLQDVQVYEGCKMPPGLQSLSLVKCWSWGASGIDLTSVSNLRDVALETTDIKLMMPERVHKLSLTYSGSSFWQHRSIWKGLLELQIVFLQFHYTEFPSPSCPADFPIPEPALQLLFLIPSYMIELVWPITKPQPTTEHDMAAVTLMQKYGAEVAVFEVAFTFKVKCILQKGCNSAALL